MITKEVIEVQTVESFDFTYSTGLTIPITIIRSEGDNIEELEDRYEIYKASRPSAFDPEQMLKPEWVTLFKAGLSVVQRRELEQQKASAEQKVDFKELLRSANVKTVN